MQISKIQMTAKALLDPQSKLPLERKQEMEQILKDFLNKDELTEADLEAVMKLEAKQINPNYKSHEQLVCEQIQSEEELHNFVKR